MAKGGRDRVTSGFLKALGSALTRARQDAGLTQEEVVGRLYPEVRSVQTISAWENGWNKVSQELFERLCSLYSISAESLLKEAYHLLVSDEGEARPVFLQGAEEELVRLYRRCASRAHRDIAVVVLKMGLEDGKGTRPAAG